MGQSRKLGARWRLHPAEAKRAVGALDIHHIKEKYAEVDGPLAFRDGVRGGGVIKIVDYRHFGIQGIVFG